MKLESHHIAIRKAATQILEEKGEKLNKNNLISITGAEIFKKCSTIFARFFNQSIAKAITYSFPDYHIEFWNFHKLNNKIRFKNIEDEKRFILYIFQLNRIDFVEENLYKYLKTSFIIGTHFKGTKKEYYGGFSLLKKYRCSPVLLIMSLFREEFKNLKVWKFPKNQYKWWINKFHVNAFMKNVYSELSKQTFYKGFETISYSNVLSIKGVKCYVKEICNNDIEEFIHQLRIRFEENSVAPLSIDEMINQSKLLITQKMGWLLPEDFYQISYQIIKDCKCFHFFRKLVNEDLIEFVKILFPKYNFFLFKFKSVKVNANWWSNEDNQKVYLNWLLDIYGLQPDKDLAIISIHMIQNNFGRSILEYHNKKGSHLKNLLEYHYPNCGLNMRDFSSLNNNKTEKQLYKLIKKYLPEEYSKQTYFDKDIPRLFYFDETKKEMRFDIVILKLKTVIEYQGIQHYKDINGLYSSDSLQKNILHDFEKKQKCKDLGWKYIEWSYKIPVIPQNVINLIFKLRANDMDHYEYKI
ncbi:hypothetical protein EI427_25675 (plasmid) [Flammeovirga pectinis]|uniref:Uncharacterized protein n=1 Tax=Flammeovirga pectinis TaxID=2494373 RepID=A0A3Q9FTI3_9BACT|nr:hypothetical protein [Flammeovirga pectinis]AZQ65628.1 hypothetical protein EI427_25675 [Flammeovirga pectinis]